MNNFPKIPGTGSPNVHTREKAEAGQQAVRNRLYMHYSKESLQDLEPTSEEQAKEIKWGFAIFALFVIVCGVIFYIVGEGKGQW